MKLYAISDLHMDSTNDKPMDIFGKNWEKHEEKIFNSWQSKVSEEDIILMPGDISWAIKLKDAEDDLRKIDNLPGTKILIKGNHDLWWSSKNKLNELGLKSMIFLKNDCFEINDIGIYGTRGWINRDDKEFDEKDEIIYTRELLRLEASLKNSNENIGKKITMIHYPPFNCKGETNEFVDIMKENQIDICLYGHLHGEGFTLIKEGLIEGIEFYCVSCDFLDFELKEIKI